MPKKEIAPERQCIVTREVRPKEDLLRFVVSPEGQLVVDWAGKLPGRGIYVTLGQSHLRSALAKKIFGRAAKQQISIADNFEEIVLAQAKQRLCAALSMARKAGAAITGFEKVQQVLQADAGVALLHASDAGEDGVKKLNKLARDVLIIDSISRSELATIMGRENPVHVVVLDGNTGDFFLAESRRFSLFIEKTTL